MSGPRVKFPNGNPNSVTVHTTPGPQLFQPPSVPVGVPQVHVSVPPHHHHGHHHHHHDHHHHHHGHHHHHKGCKIS